VLTSCKPGAFTPLPNALDSACAIGEPAPSLPLARHFFSVSPLFFLSLALSLLPSL
jgi:hypothetical protein